MSEAAAIVINDGKGTPVAHTYHVITSGLKASFREKVTSLAVIGQGRISADMKLSAAPNGMNRVAIKLEIPVLETAAANGSYSGYMAGPGVAYTLTANVDLILPNRSADAERKDLRILLSNALLNATLADAIDNLLPAY